MTRKIHKEGNLFVAAGFLIFAGCTALCFFYKTVLLYVLATITFVLLLFFTWFFRKPERKHITDENVIFSPADGRVVICEEVEEDEYLKERRLQISIFMSLWNVHANSFPVGGKIEYCKHHPGKHFIAWYPKASHENERTTTVVNTTKGKIVFRQIAGVIARRIVCYAEKMTEKEIVQNQKLGFIKFGSRVDIFIPLDAKVEVKVGQKVKSTQTVLARLS
ncbi:MAG: phosphatidylserine decarboxylase family protein [Prevotellaceae bacterium]|jgi:phosphatidylserine decarboxylase|nr:phosphatidylserine decarboxylase family protein [Prevotellaceae bacterium]